MSEENKALLRRVVEEGWNKHNLALLVEFYAEEAVKELSLPSGGGVSAMGFEASDG